MIHRRLVNITFLICRTPYIGTPVYTGKGSHIHTVVPRYNVVLVELRELATLDVVVSGFNSLLNTKTPVDSGVDAPHSLSQPLSASLSLSAAAGDDLSSAAMTHFCKQTIADLVVCICNAARCILRPIDTAYICIIYNLCYTCYTCGVY